MDKKPIPQHKRLAMGDTVKGYARGGTVGMPTRVVGGGDPVPKPTGKPMSPLAVARRNNGVPGMCKGGKMKK